MDLFCTECGAKLSGGDKFCINCGASVLQGEASAPLEPTERPPFKKEPIKVFSVNAKKAVAAANQLIGSTAYASPSGEEMVFTQAVPYMGEALSSALGPVKYLFGGIKRIFSGIYGARKDKKKLRLIIITSALWLILSLLPILGVQATSVKLLGFLTFANGGLGTGLLSGIGGIFGKGLFAYFVTALILPVFSGKKPFAGMGRGFKKLVGEFALKNKIAAAALLTGIGAALIAYHFLTGNASLQNSMAGIAAFALSLRALSRKAGFLRGFLLSVMRKFSKGRSFDPAGVNRVIAGFTAGFALSVLLSAAGIGGICFFAGIVFLIAAMILGIIANKAKVVVAQ